ncbi:hypothetical protein DK846_16635 [Methanospirillum lacunae]|uniref:Uncharacterized protein n=1 Tax=Methanospirillum lacunae TaxID=668570 RepID=A0A2V2MNX4_9EURY|nr:hypothetical protein DK846_16635 [Methanospirillum lacunae]
MVPLFFHLDSLVKHAAFLEKTTLLFQKIEFNTVILRHQVPRPLRFTQYMKMKMQEMFMKKQTPSKSCIKFLSIILSRYRNKDLFNSGVVIR